MIHAMPADDSAEVRARAGRHFPLWESADLPKAPEFTWKQWRLLIGPGLLLAGSAIGGGEWLFGPIVTARYGGQLMWIAAISILLQVSHNLCMMRYTLYTGEPILVGFFRSNPGPRFWVFFYLMLDLGGIWPYLASNAAVPLVAAFLGDLPGEEHADILRWVSYGVFSAAFLPLIFGGKVYNTVEKVMVTKIFLVLGYLGFVCLFLVSWDTWVAVFTGFLKVGSMPDQEIDWPTLAAFAAIAGMGGITNTSFSNYARDKGWGMGPLVGAIPSMVGGKKVELAHVGKVFPISEESLKRWKGWMRHLLRDQLGIWCGACLIGMALPSMLSLEYIAGAEVEGHAAAAMTARGIADSSGEVFWFLTLLCGFIVLSPGQLSDIDNIVRRWTEVIWTGSRHVRHLRGNQVKLIYYTIMGLYFLWGLIALRLTPDPLFLAIVTGALRNLGMSATALHALYVNRKLLPEPLRPPMIMQLSQVACFIFFLGISGIAFYQQLSTAFGS